MSKDLIRKSVYFTVISYVALVAGASLAIAEDAKPDFATDTLTGNWGGARDSLFEKGYSFELSYKADAWRNLNGGMNKGNRVLDNLNIIMDVDAEKAMGLSGTSFRVYLLNNFGGRPNDLVGSNGGIDNIETSTQAFKLYEAWVQQNFFNDKLSLLAGLHDLNSEFYATDTSGLFLNPTYGIGTEMAASGDNGPSIFPTTSLAFRAAVSPTDNTYLQAAIYDGVPGNPNNARGTHINFDNKDGALVVAEAGIKDDTIGHFGLGAWKYTAKRADQVTGEMTNSKGFYVLADSSFYQADSQDLSAFARVGFTAGDVEQFKSNWSFGLVGSGYVPSRPEGQIGFAVTTAVNSDKYKQANVPVESKETQFELTYADKLTPWLSIQPDLQYTVNPGTDQTLDNAWTIGVRLGVDF